MTCPRACSWLETAGAGHCRGHGPTQKTPGDPLSGGRARGLVPPCSSRLCRSERGQLCVFSGPPGLPYEMHGLGDLEQQTSTLPVLEAGRLRPGCWQARCFR